jgi:predicted nucleic acid-binding protein
MDALHVACAEAAECDWFFTTDRGILKKARNLTSMRVANPVEFFGGD